MTKERVDQTAENWRVRNDKARFGERTLIDKQVRVRDMCKAHLDR